MCLSLCDFMDHSLPGSSVHRDSPGKNAEVGCHALLQDGDLQKGLMSTHTSRNCFCQCPVPTAHNFQPMPPPLETLIMLTGRSDSVSCDITTPLLGSYCTQGFVCALQESVFIAIPKAIPKNARTTEQLLILHASKEMLKILQARLQ